MQSCLLTGSKNLQRVATSFLIQTVVLLLCHSHRLWCGEKGRGRWQKRLCSHVRQKMSFDIDDDCTQCQKEPLDREVT